MVMPALKRVPRSSPIKLSEHFILLKFDVISQNEIGGPGQFMGQSIMSHTGIGLIELSVVEIAARTMGLSGMIGGLGERPG